jgi:hypothetical protein
VGRTGFAEALEAVEWLHARRDSLEIPNFDTWLGESAKKRFKETLRKRKQRCPVSLGQERDNERDKNGTPVLFSSVLSCIDKPPPKSAEGGGGGAEILPGIPCPDLPNHAEAFGCFWAEWPAEHRQYRDSAMRAWRCINPSRAEAARIVEAVRQWKLSERWIKGMVQRADSWLEGRQWDNPAPPPPKAKAVNETTAQKIARLSEEMRCQKVSNNGHNGTPKSSA